MPKGKLTCSCGHSIQADGKNLEQFQNYQPQKESLKDRLPSLIEILLAIGILIIPVSFFLRFKYGAQWLEAENNFFSKLLGISPEFYEIIKIFTFILAFVVWLIWRRKKQKNQT